MFSYEPINLIELEKYILDEIAYEEYLEGAAQYGVAPPDGQIIYATNSKYSSAFSVHGYELLEGSHFSKEDEEREICIVSKNFATLNNLNIGSKITVSPFYDLDQIPQELEIVGIFDAPTEGYNEIWGDSPAQTIFVPYGVKKRSLESKGIVPVIVDVQLYLKNISEVEDFIASLSDEHNFLYINESHYGINEQSKIPEDYSHLKYEEFIEIAREKEYMTLQIDNEWYDMVAAPLEKSNATIKVIVIAMIICSGLIVTLISIFSFLGRNKELGLLLSIGESKAKVIF